ncbi:MAG TPA: hypothetical protein VF260_08355 [Bacilli bacterium]
MTEKEQKTPANLYILKLSFAFFATGLAVFLSTMGVMAVFLPALVRLQSFQTAEGMLLAHLLVLGWATMIAMGASFQITQVIMRTTLFSRTLGFIQFALYVAGFVLLLGGFLADARLIVYGGVLLSLGVFLYTGNLGITFYRKREWNPFVLGVSLSLLDLLATVLLGIVMGLRFAYGFGAENHAAVFGSHLWLGLGGWLSGLIIVYSFKLLPMFFVSAKKVGREAYWIIGGAQVGVWLHAASLWSGYSAIAIAGDLCLLGALGWFAVFAWQVRRQSRSKQPVGAVRVALLWVPAVFFLYLVWTVLDWLNISGDMFVTFVIILVILGWFSSTILSYLSKIFPFLWWAKRYRTREEKKSAPLLSEMLPEARMTWELCIFLAGVGVVAASFLLGSPGVAVIGQIVALIAAIVYFVELMRVFRF